MADLVGKIIGLHDCLLQAELPHAFGGALALAWCTERARGTIDIDVNIFVKKDDADRALAALPRDVKVSQSDRRTLESDGQIRVWWEKTPLDLFLNTTDYHESVAGRVRWEVFVGEQIPFLSCLDVAVFKTFFNRTKDWADIEAMHEVGTLDAPAVKAVISEYLGADDERIRQLSRLVENRGR